jgi:hypothetical protein
VPVSANLNLPATFECDLAPLRPNDWTSWQEPVNRGHIYDFYANRVENLNVVPALDFVVLTLAIGCVIAWTLLSFTVVLRGNANRNSLSGSHPVIAS